MANFLTSTAADILERYPDFQKIGIILPSRRAAVFLKKELSKLITKPVFSPYITTIEDFMLQSLGWQQADQPSLMFKLYDSYVAVAPEPKESFSDFSQWAHLLLADFNELDRYRVNAREVFDYLADVERIKKWDLDPDKEISELVQNYLKLWRLLPDVYTHFTERLKNEKVVYQGLAYREMADTIANHAKTLKEQYEKFVFIGFNALNASEEEMLRTLYHEGLADFYWDVDEYYFNDVDQEAGNFLRQSKLVRELTDKDDFRWMHNSLSEIPKNIEVVNVSGRQQQAIAANSAVLRFQEKQLEDVAVVLADEEMLMPFLNNLAADVSTLNVTMGLPLSNTPVAGFFQLLLEMFQEFESSGRRDKEGHPSFHFQKWDDMLGHPLFKRWVGDAVSTESLRYYMRKQNRIFISAAELQQESSDTLNAEFVEFFANQGNTLSQIWTSLAKLAEHLHQAQPEKTSLLQSLFGFYKLFNRLSILMAEYPYVDDIKTALRFYKDLLKSETLDLYGEPLSGLQVMGVLETRTLDFKNIVMTSLNEDILPKGRSDNSLIPFDIKREFGLPTYLDKDAVFAYHFYRLIQRAENITLIYNGLSEGLGSGEPSRFIKQLEYELPKANRRVKFEYINPTFEVKIEDKNATDISKTPAIMERLKEMAVKGFSATAITDYINDPVEFYKKRVLNLQEADEVEEVAGYDKQGNVVHNILERLYSVMEGDEIVKCKSVLHANDSAFALSEEEIRNLVVDELRKEAKLADLDVGKNLLIREILVGMLVNFLRKEKEELEKLEAKNELLSLLGLELDLSCQMTLKSGQVVKLKGIIDRVDRISGELRVIDYKTGSVIDGNLNIKTMSDLRQPKDKNKSLQLLMYAYLYFNNYQDYDSLNAGIISLRNVSKWPMPFKMDRKTEVTRDLVSDFEGFLRGLMEEIFDESIPFSKKLVTLESDE